MLYAFAKNVQYKPIQCKLRIFQKKFSNLHRMMQYSYMQLRTSLTCQKNEILKIHINKLHYSTREKITKMCLFLDYSSLSAV